MRIKLVYVILFVFLLAVSASAQGAAKKADLDLQSMTALELALQMGNGINLGNTMEAYGRPYLGTKADVSDMNVLGAASYNSRNDLGHERRADCSASWLGQI